MVHLLPRNGIGLTGPLDANEDAVGLFAWLATQVHLCITVTAPERFFFKIQARRDIEQKSRIIKSGSCLEYTLVFVMLICLFHSCKSK